MSKIHPVVTRSHLNVLTFSPLTGGCSEGLDTFRFFFKHNPRKIRTGTTYSPYKKKTVNLSKTWERVLKWERTATVLYVLKSELVNFEGTFGGYLYNCLFV